MSNTDMSLLSALAMRLPRELGLQLRVWNAGGGVLGVDWELYAVPSAKDKYPNAKNVCGYTVEGPAHAARYIEEQLINTGILEATP